MRKFTRVILLSLVACILLTVGVFAVGNSYTKELVANYVGVRLVVNGTPVTPKDVNGNIVEPFIVDGTTYLPVRAVAEALGKDVGWDNDTKTVYISEKGDTPTPESTDAQKSDLVPMTAEVEAVLDTPIKDLSKDVAENAIALEYGILANEIRRGYGTGELAWDQSVADGLSACLSLGREKGGREVLLKNLHYEDVLKPNGLKVFDSGSRWSDLYDLGIDGSMTPRQIAKRLADDTSRATTLLVDPNLPGKSRLDLRIPGWQTTMKPTAFGFAVLFTGSGDCYWNETNYFWGVIGDINSPSMYDDWYETED